MKSLVILEIILSGTLLQQESSLSPSLLYHNLRMKSKVLLKVQTLLNSLIENSAALGKEIVMKHFLTLFLDTVAYRRAKETPMSKDEEDIFS